MDLYLMSPPGKDWQLRGRANFRSRDAEPVDAMRARAEWLTLARAIEEAGGRVAVLPPVSGLTGLPYAAECGHAVGRLFLLPNMWAPHRKTERDHWKPFAQKLDFEVVTVDGTWEAQGDVATFDSATLLFFGGRTDRAGMESARRFFEGEIIPIEIREPAFHGNMALLPLAHANRILVCPSVIVGDGLARLEARFGDRVVHVSEDEIRSYATNGLPVGRTWLAPSVVPARVRELVTSFGMDVRTLDMRELCEKAGGASRCLVCVVPGAGEITIPKGHRIEEVIDG